MNTMMIGYAIGAVLIVVEVTAILAVTIFGKKLRASFPRLASNLSIGVKTTSYRFCAGLDTFLVSWFVTGNPYASVGIVGLELATKFFLYYGHEWMWNRPFLAKLLHVEKKMVVA